MAQQAINLGTAPLATDGDTPRTAFDKVNGIHQAAIGVTSYSGLRGISSPSDGDLARISSGSGIDGFFRYNESETSPDNGGTIIENGSGAWVRQRAPFADNYYNALWFEAKGDNSNDDTAELQSFFDAIPDGGIGEIPNTGNYYKCTSTITLTANSVKIIGPNVRSSGVSALNFTGMAGSDALVIDGIDNTIEHLSVWSTDKSSGVGITAKSTATNIPSYLTLRNVDTYQHGGTGILVHRPDTCVFDHVKSTYNGGYGVNFDGSLSGGGGGTTVTMRDCWVEYNDDQGVYAKSITGMRIDGGLYARNNQTGTTAIPCIDLELCSGVEIGGGVDGEGSTTGFVRSNGTSEGITIGACYIGNVGSGEAGIRVNGSKGVLIDGPVFNTVNASGYHLAIFEPDALRITSIIDRDASNPLQIKLTGLGTYTQSDREMFLDYINTNGMSGEELAVGASSFAIAHNFAVPTGYKPYFKSINGYTSSGTTDARIVIWDQAGGNAAYTASSDANGHIYADPNRIFNQTNRRFQVRVYNDDAGSARDIWWNVEIGLVPLG